MGDSRSLATRRRRLRRATLALMLLAGMPVLAQYSYAQQPPNATLRMLPPLPLNSSQASNRVQSNPFCQAPRHNSGVQLASGTASAPIKLKPVGTAIELQQIHPVESAPATISIGVPIASGVQANPIVAQSAIQTSAENPSGQSQTTIRLVRPTTQLPTPGQAVQQAVIPAPQAIPSAPVVQPNAPAIVNVPVRHATAVGTPPGPTPRGPSVPQRSEATQDLPEDSLTSEPPQARANERDLGSVASMLKANPDPKKPTLVEESEAIFFSFSDESDTPASEVVESLDAADSVAATTDVSQAPLPAAVKIAEPITALPQSAPRSVLQNVEPTLENGSSGFPAVKVAHPNIRAVVNPFVNEQSSGEVEEQRESELSNVETEQLANQGQTPDDEFSLLTFDPPVVSAEAPGMTGQFVDPIQLDEEETDEVESAPQEGTSGLATSNNEPSEPSVERSVLAPIQDVMKSGGGEPIAIYRTEPAVAKVVPQGEETLHTKRYRLPVAVKRVPIDFERKDLPSAAPAFVKEAADPMQNAVASAKPAVASAESAVASAKPAVASAEPAVASAEPTVASAEPTVASAKPTVASAKPTAASAKPTVASAKPTAAAAEPAVASAEPTVASAEPAVASAEPAVASAEPAVASAKPTVASAKPAVASAEPAAERKIDKLGVELGPEVKLTPLHMNQAQVRSLTLGGSVTDVRVGDKDICQAFASGPNQLKLIGTGRGVTRLVVWAAPDGEKEKTLMRAFEIHVGDVAPTEGESVSDTVHLLNSSIQRAFPNCRANVGLVRGELHVVGQCDNQESAKKIIRMVRKSCLIPVRDQLSVQ